MNKNVEKICENIEKLKQYCVSLEESSTEVLKIKKKKAKEYLKNHNVSSNENTPKSSRKKKTMIAELITSLIEPPSTPSLWEKYTSVLLKELCKINTSIQTRRSSTSFFQVFFLNFFFFFFFICFFFYFLKFLDFFLI